MYCLKCGNKIEEDAKFCSKCGKSVSEGQPSDLEKKKCHQKKLELL